VKYLKKYKKFFEDGDSGSGDVVAAQPGALPGTTGTTGSGDIGFVFKKKKRKKGDPDEVSDLRDLKEVETNKIEENYTDSEIVDEIRDVLKSKNYRPIEINQMIDSYSTLIGELIDEELPVEIIKSKIMELLPDTGDSGFLKAKMPQVTNRNITYM
jgi:hypothetical protein